MTDTDTPADPKSLAALVRQACVDAALGSYEDALSSGLCREGAWEVAVGAMRSVDVDGLSRALAEQPPTASPCGHPELREATAQLSARFGTPGARAAGSAAAITGSVAAGLLEWAAGVSKSRGPESFRRRAEKIRGRAAALQLSLASAAGGDANVVSGFFRKQARGDEPEAIQRAMESVLEIGARCGQVATLAAELAAHGDAAIRSDVVAALRLVSAASESSLGLAEENLRAAEEDDWVRSAKRRAWRTRLLLQRATPILHEDLSG